MTKRLFIIISIIFFLGMAIFLRELFAEGSITLALGIGCAAVLAWAFLKIKFEYQGYDEPKKKGPQSF